MKETGQQPLEKHSPEFGLGVALLQDWKTWHRFCRKLILVLAGSASHKLGATPWSSS